MSTMNTSAFTRPTSVMSLLAEQMESSRIQEVTLIECAKSQAIDFKPVPNDHLNFSLSAPNHRYSIPNSCFSTFDHKKEFTMDHESDLSSPHLPHKRLCHSSTYDGIARPIPIKLNIKCEFKDTIQENPTHCNFLSKQSRMSRHKANMTIKTPQRHQSDLNTRPIISAHYKKSAFTPISPQTTSSDYSISPDTESPIHRPASFTSSGYHECSPQSLLMDLDSSPDSNERSNYATTVNSTTDSNEGVFHRCHSQPCHEPFSRHFHSLRTNKYVAKIHHKPSSHLYTPLKRRYPLKSHVRSISQSENTNVQNLYSPMYFQSYKPSSNSADTSPSACRAEVTILKRENYFFGNGRSYLIGLPRIASSPPSVSTHVQRQRVGSNSSSLSTSTTTDTNTPTVICNGGNLQQKSITDSTNFNFDIEMDDLLNEHRSTITFSTGNFSCMSLESSSSVSVTSDMITKSNSTTSGGTSYCTNVSCSINSENSSRSEFRDHDDPPEIGFCFTQLNDHPPDYDQHSSFQELDIDQIELD